jgi:NADPH2:quinone reductase
MKAIGVRKFGGAANLELMDVPRPEPGPGEVLVKVACAGVNFIDIYMRSGAYKRSDTYETPLPMVLGMEGAGQIVACGQGVTSHRVGELVAWCLARGSYAEYATVPAWRLVGVPPGVPMSVATALMLQGMTAHYLAHSAYPLKKGEFCLVHAASGGVGQLLVQLAKMRGAIVIATVGSKEKAEIANARGADYSIVYTEEDFQPLARDLTNGKGVDVVYDSVGKDTLSRSIRSLRRRGTCILFGGSSGMVDCVDPLDLAEAGSVFFTRPHLADYLADAEEVGMRAGDLFRAAASGRLVVSIDREYPLDDARLAHEAMEARKSRGKILLTVE